jgi:tetratricopeptide (TPR) repeat protein
VEGEEAFRKALEINPQYPGAQLNLGSMLEAQGNLAGAMALYQKILESNPDDSQAHFSLGRLLVNQENYSEGIQHFLRTISAGEEERKPTYLYALGAAYARSGDRANAARYLHLAREKAAARGQSELVQSIDDDLRILETEGSPK